MGLEIGLGHYLTVAAILFTLGVLGIFINRKNVIVILMSIELMLLAVNINFVAFSRELGDAAGQVFVADDVPRRLGVSDRQLHEIVLREDALRVERETRYRQERQPYSFDGRFVVLVDDGIATGATMAVAARAERAQALGRERSMLEKTVIGIADVLAEGSMTAAQIAARIDGDEETTHRLLRGAVACNLCRMDRHTGAVTLTRMGAVLRTGIVPFRSRVLGFGRADLSAAGSLPGEQPQLQVPVIADDYVDKAFGTGVVKVSVARSLTIPL